ncbi:hypothetical protein [Paenibacillus sp. OV219]|uniref:hypothetical protein n=1 Tax=Paenibacillus sp. OV219 TaxID=1884377 RepID=UPI0008C99B48|nr:hypothetical protein [Paenibacillus sp. OV219]SEM81636.1 hypothetical protein SAMN05518847_101877 [Paenibacillus sp. OV219]
MNHLFIDQASITRRKDNSVIDAWGKAEVLEPSTHRCRIESVGQLVIDQHGKEITSGTSITFLGSVPISYEDEVHWNDAFGHEMGKTPIRIEAIRDFQGKVRTTVVNLP